MVWPSPWAIWIFFLWKVNVRLYKGQSELIILLLLFTVPPTEYKTSDPHDSESIFLLLIPMGLFFFFVTILYQRKTLNT